MVLLGDSTSLEANDLALYPRLRNFHTAIGEGLGGMTADPAHIISGGCNGWSCNFWNATPGLSAGNYTLANLLVDLPDLVVFCFGINDVRAGGSSQAQLTADLTTAIQTIRKSLPNTDIVLRMPNSFTTDDVGALGYVIPNGSAQAYTDMMRQSYLSLIDRWPNVVVWDAMERIFGATCQTQAINGATWALMADQIHPSNFGYSRIADGLVADVIGYKVPFAKDKALAAIMGAPTSPWTIYPRAVEHPDFYTLVTQGDYVGQGSTSIILAASNYPFGANRGGGTDFSGIRAAEIQPNDIVQMGRDTVFRLPATVGPASSSSGYAGFPHINLLTLGSSIPVNAVTNGTVRIWRELGGGDGLVAALQKSQGLYRFLRVGRLLSGGAYPTIRAEPENVPGIEPAAQWALNAADTMYVSGYTPSPISVGGDFRRSGNDLQMGGFSPDLTAYVGNLVVIVGNHPPEVLADHAVNVAVAVGTVAAQSSVDVAVTYTGAIYSTGNLNVTGVVAQPRAAMIAGVLWTAWASAADTVTVRFINPTVAGIVVGTVNFDFWLVR
jgi:lysophospholipase L1-like esterase